MRGRLDNNCLGTIHQSYILPPHRRLARLHGILHRLLLFAMEKYSGYNIAASTVHQYMLLHLAHGFNRLSFSQPSVLGCLGMDWALLSQLSANQPFTQLSKSRLIQLLLIIIVPLTLYPPCRASSMPVASLDACSLALLHPGLAASVASKFVLRFAS